MMEAMLSDSCDVGRLDAMTTVMRNDVRSPGDTKSPSSPSTSYKERLSTFSPIINDISRILQVSDCHHGNMHAGTVTVSDRDHSDGEEENVVPRQLFLQALPAPVPAARREQGCLARQEERPIRTVGRRGQLRLSINASQHCLTVHVHQARQLKSRWTSAPSCYVQITLIPGEEEGLCHTTSVHVGNHPDFDEQFTLDMMDADMQKRLKVAMYNKEGKGNARELLGCMTFGVKHLKSHKTNVDSWYYLLSEEVGKRKHVQASATKRPAASKGTKTPTNQSGTSSAKSQRSSALIPDVNRSLRGLDTTTVVVKRGRHGYGFTVMGSSPVTIGKVDDGCPAASAGLRKNDVVVRINGQNVSRSTADSVAKIVKNSLKQIVLDVVRPNRSQLVTASSNFKTQENPVYGSVTSSNLYEFPSDACCEGFYGRASGAGSASERSSRSSLTRKIPSATSLSSRGLNDTLPLRPSQSDNVASLSRSQKKTSLSSQSSHGSVSIEESGKISCERSIRKSLRKTVTSQVHGVHIVTKAEMTITTNTYDSLRWDASNESIFFNENEEIYDELPWKPFDCNMMASPVAATEETYETMCSVDDAVHDTANETFLDASSDADESKMLVADYAHTTLPEMSFCDLSHRERARQAAACQLLRAEAEFIAAMQYGIQRYSRPLRHCILSAGEHRILFQNVEKLVAFSEYHVRQMAEGSLSYCDVNSSGRRYVDVVGSVYVQRAAILCEAYQLYARGLREALRLLSDLRTYEQFHAFLDAPAAEPGKPGIAEFLRKPEEHLQTLMVTLRTVLSHTSRDHCDAAALSRVVKAFSACCNKVQHTPIDSHSKNTSAGGSSSGSGTTSFTSGESSTSSHSSSSTRSKSSSASVDSELLDIQERLVFPAHVTAFRLAVPSRHVIYSGELLRVEDCQWRRVVVVLLSDLLLVTRVEGDSLIVVEDPLPLPEVMNSEFGGSHPCEFTLTAEVRSADHVDWEARHILLRAPSMEQACTWKSLLQQRLANFRTHHELMTGRSREAVF